MSELLMIAILIIGGLVLLYFGADWLVKGAVTISLKFGLSPLIVGLTVVALGTSLPEALVSIQATLDNQGGID
jgi:Ca2+/Na+ antiporter